eukprot:15469996-Alexandrium_andersonii.AAC.1
MSPSWARRRLKRALLALAYAVLLPGAAVGDFVRLVRLRLGHDPVRTHRSALAAAIVTWAVLGVCLVYYALDTAWQLQPPAMLETGPLVVAIQIRYSPQSIAWTFGQAIGVALGSAALAAHWALAFLLQCWARTPRIYTAIVTCGFFAYYVD